MGSAASLASRSTDPCRPASSRTARSAVRGTAGVPAESSPARTRMPARPAAAVPSRAGSRSSETGISAITAGEESRRLAEEFAEPQWAAAADTAISLVAAMRGDEPRAELLAARAEAVAEPTGANITMAFAQFGKVLAALATSRHTEAYACAERLFDPADSAFHPVISSWLIADLAEAAVHIDRLEAARTRVAQVETMAGRQPGAWIALALGHPRALVAEPSEAGERFYEALASDLTRWPFERARIQLTYGQWLRRQRKVALERPVDRVLAGLK